MLKVAVLPSSENCLPVSTLISSLPYDLASSLHVQSSADSSTIALLWLPTLALGNTSSALRAVLSTAPNIRFVQLPMTGVDDFLPLMRELRTSGREVVWCCAKGCYGGVVAEHALALCLGLLRGLHRSPPAAGREVESMIGRRVVIIGAGSIGVRVRTLLHPFECQASTTTSSTTKEQLLQALALAEVVFITCPLTPTTRGLFDETLFAAMPASCVLVNVARGEIVDTRAMISALQEGRLKGAALDIVSYPSVGREEQEREVQELVQRGKLLLTPHSAIPTQMIPALLGERIRHNLEVMVNGGTFAGQVDVETGY
ncbi:D-isomer specific 2-hydroxyacid dehydrogenase, NAD-binding [Kalmanozyma brasiliensis GHG001]|uniref:D-isomer specific 2-hydroxyacid dehydrogenase, NAD-binding n=1 Tax=Kalmanozyma brasiliensis (strain GHG001) TaxID=1365824 RepID=UPI001CE92717|nr:D-isomer specific 2-hydroxyacid dehydrogenase, NAD-binding [Kalmanozyma brasiliensis GHG001]KAF6767287.1 D-isomer specific 2-hydroxyacid dehydrogenase, NAD-binding [Kalmanozyma brasiliensis GHG001]